LMCFYGRMLKHWVKLSDFCEKHKIELIQF
jgi:hypothetical protein